MNQQSINSTESNGRVSVEAMFEKGTLSAGGRLQPSACYTWHPPRDLEDHFEPDFSISFYCFEMENSGRRFAPVEGIENYIKYAFMAGLELLRRDHGLSKEQHHSYLVMRMLFSRVRNTHTHLDREFLSESDLRVKRTGRGGEIDACLLPEDLGTNKLHEGKPWSISILCEEGRQAAQRQGIANPDESQSIQHGFAEAALRRPLEIPHAEVSNLIKTALFDVEDFGNKPDADLADFVIERFISDQHKHLDVPLETFQSRLVGGKSNYPKVLTGGKRTSQNRIPIEEVKRVLANEGWRAYAYVTDCLEIFARSFCNALPEQLNSNELRHFDHVYKRQSHFGDMPLLLLFERSKFLEPIIFRLFDEPGNQECVGALHRLLQWYAEMVQKRREADRRFKSKKNAKGANDKDEIVFFQRIVNELASRRKCLCPHCEKGLVGSLVPDDNEKENVRIYVYCKCEHFDTTIHTTKTEIAAIGRELSKE